MRHVITIVEVINPETRSAVSDYLEKAPAQRGVISAQIGLDQALFCRVAPRRDISLAQLKGIVTIICGPRPIASGSIALRRVALR